MHLLNLVIFVYNTAKTVVLWFDQSNHMVGTQQESGSAIVTLPRTCMTTQYRDDKDVVKQFRRQHAVGNMLDRKFSFAHMVEKSQLLIVILLPNLLICFLAIFIPELY